MDKWQYGNITVPLEEAFNPPVIMSIQTYTALSCWDWKEEFHPH
jgi:hypothetical protein